MIRQANSYLAGAMSGSALIAAAIAAFVLLVSLQALKDWPISGLGGGSDATVSLSSRQPATRAIAPAPGSAGRAKTRHTRGGAGNGDPAQHRSGAIVKQVDVGSASPGTAAPPASGNPGSGGNSSPPGTSSTPSQSGGGSGPTLPGSGGGGSGSGSGGGSGGGSVSASVTSTVDNTVSEADNTVGGTLGNTGVTKVTEGVVNGVAGPESPAGHAVDETVGTVGGLLGGHR